MAKKKRKTFQKNQLLSMFQNGNYQKVISKIKQFKIEGMSDEELHKIKLNSYELLASNNFGMGDVARALRDIESFLSISDSEPYRLIKLKYLCYLEHFEDAVEFGEDLILSKDNKIKKEAMFFYLLASIYDGNYEVNQKYLKLLSPARQNYILGFVEFLRGNINRALEFLNRCNPRIKVEKENLQAIKSIILNEEIVCSDTVKPFYRFLICGDDKNLQNTKNIRVIKKEILSQFSKNKKESDMKNLLSLKSAISIETILHNTKDEEQKKKLIYNNIVLLMEKQENYDKALGLFVKYRLDLVLMVESALLFMSLKSHTEDKKSDKIIIQFFSNYFKLHYKKLSEFQLDYIFIFLAKNINTKIDMTITFDLIKEYGGGDIVFLLKDIPLMTKIGSSYQDNFNKIVKRYSYFKNIMLTNLSNQLESIDEEFEALDKEEKEPLSARLILLISLLKNLQQPHKKYQKTLFDIFGNLALVCQSFELKKHKKLYLELAETIDVFIDYYRVNKIELPVDIKALFVSIDKGKSLKITKYDDERMFDFLRSMFEDEDNSDRYDFNEYEYDLSLVKKEFIIALQNNQDIFALKFKKLNAYRYSNVIYEFILDVIAKAIEFNRYDSIFIARLLVLMNLQIEDELFREKMVPEVCAYAKKDANVAKLFLYTCITRIDMKDRKYVWYLKWLEGYIMLVADYDFPQDKAFYSCLHHFKQTQEKKKFKSLDAKYKKIVKKFKERGGLFD